jgi:uncharacterized coiled-coil protein SlyX
MDKTEKRLAELEKKIAHLEAECRRLSDMAHIIHRLTKENHNNIKEYVLKQLFKPKGNNAQDRPDFHGRIDAGNSGGNDNAQG